MDGSTVKGLVCEVTNNSEKGQIEKLAPFWSTFGEYTDFCLPIKSGIHGSTTVEMKSANSSACKLFFSLASTYMRFKYVKTVDICCRDLVYWFRHALNRRMKSVLWNSLKSRSGNTKKDKEKKCLFSFLFFFLNFPCQVKSNYATHV